MSFPYTCKTLRRGKTYDSNERLEMSAQGEAATEEVATDTSERNDEILSGYNRRED